MIELLILLNLARLNDSSVHRIRELAESVEDWEEFFSLMEWNATSVLTWRRISILSPNWNIRSSSNLQSELKKQELKLLPLTQGLEKRYQKLEQILKEMDHAGIEVILLKGSLFNAAVYSGCSSDHSFYKKMNDVDLLVRFEDAPKSAQVLKKLGFSNVGDFLGKEEISAQTHHALPYFHLESQSVIGLHWGLHSKESHWKMDLEEIWAYRIPIPFGQSRAYRMSWEDNLLHLCIHLPFYKTGLRELADIYNLVLFSQPKADWRKFHDKVVRSRAFDPVYRSLSLADSLSHSFCEGIVPREFLSQWKQNASLFTIQDTEKLTSSRDLLLRSRSTYLSKIEKAFLLFRLSPNFFERFSAWAATWSLTFFPDAQTVRTLSRLPDSKLTPKFLRARIRTPFLILSALARDHGTSLIVFGTFENIVIVIKNIFSLSFLKSAPSLRSGPMKNLLRALE